MKKRIVIIPAYEPGEKLIELLKEIDRKKFDIVVIDDGSGNDYDTVFVSANKYAKVLRYDKNCGKGYALKFGFRYVLDHYSGDYLIITMDSDGQHRIEDAEKLCLYCKDNPNSLVLGMRKRNINVPIRSRLGNSITKFIFGFVTGVNVYDTQTGFRVFSNQLLTFLLSIDGDRFEYEMNVLLKCSRRGILIKEIPIQTIYIENNSHSHFHTIKDSYRIYKEIIKFCFSSILSFFIDYSLFVLLFFLIKNYLLSNIFARLISSSFNYFFNRTFVFQSQNSIVKSFLLYFLLVGVILILNSCILNILILRFSINLFIAKFVTEILLFFCSWWVQRNVIFFSCR